MHRPDWHLVYVLGGRAPPSGGPGFRETWSVTLVGWLCLVLGWVEPIPDPTKE